AAGERGGGRSGRGGRHSELRVCDHGSSPSVTTERWPGCRSLPAIDRRGSAFGGLVSVPSPSRAAAAMPKATTATSTAVMSDIVLLPAPERLAEADGSVCLRRLVLPRP